MGRKKKRRINKAKFLSRIIILLVLIILIVVLVKGLTKKDEKPEITVIINNEDITSALVNKPYITKGNDVYLSIEDMRNFFDKNIFYEEQTDKILTTSETKSAAIGVNSSTIQINTATLTLQNHILEYGKTFYIPVSEISNVYNIEYFITEDSVVINSLYKELITINTTKKASLKEDMGFFSKTIKKLDKNTEVIYVEEVKDGKWIKVITYDGDIGYIKNKNVSEKTYKRTNMDNTNFSDNTGDISNSIEINNSKINAENMNNFDTRKSIVDQIISEIISKEKFTVNVNLENVNVEETLLKRFVLELLPRLKEIGGKVIITNNNILDTNFLIENNLS